MAVMDGGFAKWEKEQRPVESGSVAVTVRVLNVTVLFSLLSCV